MSAFSSRFDNRFAWGQGACQGAFGSDVLSGLVEGIDAFRTELEHDRRARSLGSAMLGAFMWLDDAELVERIADFPAACVVVTKQSRRKRQQAKVDELKSVVERGAGFPLEALPGLGPLVFRDEGEIPLVGPDASLNNAQLPALRTLGYRKEGNHLVPILHTKMVLLGELWWHDEGPLGEVADVIGFTPRRLWMGSANGTASSRRNLEFGLWLEDRALLDGALRFLVEVLAQSEDWDPDSSDSRPDLVEPDYDDEAMAEAMSEAELREE